MASDVVTVIRGCRFPHDRGYHADYNVWVQGTENGDAACVTIGATAYGVARAVEFFAFQPKPAGTVIEAGRAVGILELSKTVVSVRTPVSGTIIAVNEAAATRPSLIGQDPYGAGWLVRLAVSPQAVNAAALVCGDRIAAAFEAEMALENFEGVR